ncbi:MAG: DUF2461 domain-containing protein [Aestuariibaculum sp.]
MNVTIPKSAFTFLSKLEKNNNRDWFNNNKKEFQAIQKEVNAFFEVIKNNLNQHDDIDKLKMFRIYRDVRFSKNKAPYKTNFGGSFHRTKPKLRGGYYIHIEPGESFIATGFWQPEPADLLRIRKEFEMDDSEMRDILNNTDIKTLWGNIEGEAVKTAPKGFDKEHKAIDLIRKKQYYFIRKFSDKEVTGSQFFSEVTTSFKAIRPYFDYMSDVLTTDLNGVSVI